MLQSVSVRLSLCLCPLTVSKTYDDGYVLGFCQHHDNSSGKCLRPESLQASLADGITVQGGTNLTPPVTIGLGTLSGICYVFTTLEY